MARIEGPVVSDIQGVVAENWMECYGEILTGAETYKPHKKADGVQAFAIKSYIAYDKQPEADVARR